MRQLPRLTALALLLFPLLPVGAQEAVPPLPRVRPAPEQLNPGPGAPEPAEAGARANAGENGGAEGSAGGSASAEGDAGGPEGAPTGSARPGEPAVAGASEAGDQTPTGAAPPAAGSVTDGKSTVPLPRPRPQGAPPTPNPSPQGGGESGGNNGGAAAGSAGAGTGSGGSAGSAKGEDGAGASGADGSGAGAAAGEEGTTATPPPRMFQDACPAVLKGLVEAEAVPTISDGACGTRSPLSVTGVLANGRMIPFSGAATLTCGMATALPEWIGDVDSYLKAHDNTGIKDVLVGTSYYCRNVNNQSTGRLSEHAFANGMDVVGFTLEDGRKVTVEQAWTGTEEQGSRIVRFAHDAACTQFTTTLGPEANAEHHDHLHVDLGCHGKTCTARLCE